MPCDISYKYIGIDWPINSSIITSFGSLFSCSSIYLAIAEKEKVKIISKPIKIIFEDKFNMWKKNKVKLL